MSLTDRPVDLHAEQIDVALRMGPLERLEPDVAQVCRGRARHLCEPAISSREFGAPESPADLARHRCIVFTAPGRGRWPFRTADGGLEHAEVPATFASDNLECILQLALQGAGIARLADFMAARAIRAGASWCRCSRRSTDPERRPALAVFSAAAPRRSRRSRVFLDFLIERFGREAWRLGKS